jgi:hypothetical protein
LVRRSKHLPCPGGNRVVIFKERSAVSEINFTAAAWVSEMRLRLAPGHEGDMEWRWKLLAEVSVATALGKPLGSLPKSAWSLHVTDYTGRTQAPSFTVTKANVSGQVIPGFYILSVDDLRLVGFYVAPTALGLAVDHKGSHGQIVVPVAIAGYRVVQLHAPWMP